MIIPIICNQRRHMPSHWHRRMHSSLHRRRTKRTDVWNLPKMLRAIVWPVGEEREVTFWVQCCKTTVPCTCVLSGLLLIVVWLCCDGQWLRPEDSQQNWGVLWLYTWDALCGLNTTTCHSFIWLPPVAAMYLITVGGVLLRVSWCQTQLDQQK